MASFLDTLDLLMGNGLARLSPEEMNARLLWPDGAGGFTSTAQPVTPAAASPTRADFRAAPRPYLLVGEGATPRGIASIARPLMFPLLAPTPPAPLDTANDFVLGAALYRVATELTFGAAAAISSVEIERHWTIGTLFPLPIWSPTANQWRVDVPRLVAAATAVNAAAWATEAVFTARPPRTLDRADATNDSRPLRGADGFATAYDARGAMRARFAAAGFNGATEAAAVAAETRWNPYALLFRLLDTSLVLDAVAAAQVAPFATAIWDELTAPEATLLAHTSAGNAWLRRLWTWWGLPTANASQKAAIRSALGLTNDDLQARAPNVAGHLEPGLFGYPPLPVPSAATSNKKPPVRLPMMGFGRRVAFIGQGYPLGKPTNHGTGVAGDVTPVQYLVPPAGDVRTRPLDPSLIAGGTPAQKAQTQEQWGRILSALSRTEGAMDAATTWDRAICSLGFQQWSMHEPLEGPVLLERLKRIGPVHYDVLLRALGIETGRMTDAAPSPVGAGIADLGTEACFFALTPSAAPTKHVAPGGTTEKAIADVRQNVFGWTLGAGAGTWIAGAPAMRLCARWAVAARYSPELMQAQAELAMYRIRRAASRIRTASEVAKWAPILALPQVPPASGGGAATVFDLFGTEALLGLAVDMSVNTPSDVNAAMRRALVRALAVLAQDGMAGAPAALDDRFFTVLAMMFLTERYYHGTPVRNKKGVLTDIETPRHGQIDVALGRVRLLLDSVGAVRDLPAHPVNPTLAALLKTYGIDRSWPLSLTASVLWP